METTKTTRVMSKWRVSSNGWGEDKTYQVYRRIDVNATDHSFMIRLLGNRENRGGVFDSKAEAQAYADKLNAGEDIIRAVFEKPDLKVVKGGEAK